MTDFVAILEHGPAGWGVRFPDVPGCVGAGDTPEAAIAGATEALRDVVAHRHAAGAPVPHPSSLRAVLESGEVETGETTLLIPLPDDAAGTVRTDLTLDARLLAAIDAEAARCGLTRSAFLASAAREKIEARH
jgi:predicted RNase H-like HicB family nuclease